MAISEVQRLRDLLQRALDFEYKLQGHPDGGAVNGSEDYQRGVAWMGEAQLALGEEPVRNIAVSIHHPEAEPEVVTQGDVEAYIVDLGGAFDITSPEAMDAGGALQTAATIAKEANGLPQGDARDALENAVEQIVEAFGKYEEGIAELDDEDKALLEPYLYGPAAVGEVHQQGGRGEDLGQA